MYPSARPTQGVVARPNTLAPTPSRRRTVHQDRGQPASSLPLAKSFGGRALAPSLVVFRSFGFLQPAGQGNALPAPALEDRTRREPHLLRPAEDQPLAALLAPQYHASGSAGTPHRFSLLLCPLTCQAFSWGRCVSCLRSVLLSRGRRYTHPGRVNNVNAVEVKASDAKREAAR